MSKSDSRKTTTILTLVGALLVGAVAAGVAAPSHAAESPSPNPVSGPLDAQFPYCSWWVETSTQNSNILYPDTSAAYWTMPFTIDDTSVITLRGYYPDARYFSLQVYDQSGQLDTSAGATGFTDYQLVPDAGSVNPWQSQDPYPSDGQTYSLTISSSAAKPTDATNWLSMPSSATGAIGWLMMRVYMPNDPPYPTSILGDVTSTQSPPFDLVAKLLPTVTLTGASSETDTLPQCSSTQGAQFMTTTDAGRDLTTVLTTSESEGIFESRSVAGVKRPDVRDCTDDADGCTAESVDFVRPTNKQTPYPNADSAYIAASYTLERDEALVVMARIPTTPWNVGDGSVPTVWPQDSLEMRYVSFCSYRQQAPYPVVEVTVDGSTVWGCSTDVDIHSTDPDDVIVTIVTTPANKPEPSDVLGEFVWLPIDPKHASAPYVFAIRNMLPNASFAESATNIEKTDDAAAAAAVLRSYYPVAVICDVEALEKLGPSECASAHHRSRICAASDGDADLTPKERAARLMACIKEIRAEEGEVDGIRHLAGCMLKQRSDCTGMSLARAKLREASLNRARLAHADLTNADLRDSALANAVLHNAVARGADLGGVKASTLQAHNANLSEANFAKAVLDRASLVESNLSGASLNGARAVGSDLRGADLTGADLRGADLSGANLSGADLTGARLDGANLSGATVHDAAVDASQLASATTTAVDTSTIRPPTTCCKPTTSGVRDST